MITNNSSIINKTNNYLSHQIIGHKRKRPYMGHVAGFIVNFVPIIKTIADILYTGRKTTINGSLETVEKDIITFLIGSVKQPTRYEVSEFWR